MPATSSDSLLSMVMNEGGTETGIEHVTDMDNARVAGIVKPKLCDNCEITKTLPT